MERTGCFPRSVGGVEVLGLDWLGVGVYAPVLAWGLALGYAHNVIMFALLIQFNVPIKRWFVAFLFPFGMVFLVVAMIVVNFCQWYWGFSRYSENKPYSFDLLNILFGGDRHAK